MNFVSKSPINDIPASVQIMAWRRPGDKPLSEAMMVSLLTHICVTRPQWVNLVNRYEERRKHTRWCVYFVLLDRALIRHILPAMPILMWPVHQMEWSFMTYTRKVLNWNFCDHILGNTLFSTFMNLLCECYRSPVNSPHKSQWRGALMFSLICTWMNGWVNNREAGDLRRHRTHYDVTVMCPEVNVRY